MFPSLRNFRVSANNLNSFRGFAVTGRHSKNVANKKNKLDAAKTRTYNRLGVKILMVYVYIPISSLHIIHSMMALPILTSGVNTISGC
jgi:hypothetical protein